MLTSESHLWTGGYPRQGCGTLGLDVPMPKPDKVRVRCPKCGGLAWADADQVADGVALLLCCGERMVEARDET